MSVDESADVLLPAAEAAESEEGAQPSRRGAWALGGVLALLVGACLVVVSRSGDTSAVGLRAGGGELQSLVEAPGRGGPPPGGSKSCPCVGVVGQVGTYDIPNRGTVSSDWGGECFAWDRRYSKECKTDGPKPAYCDKAWCFVNPCTCNLAVQDSEMSDDIKYRGKQMSLSYQTCGEAPGPNAQQETRALKEKVCANTDLPEAVWGNPKCRCRGYSGIKGTIVVSEDTTDSNKQEFKYPGDLGSRCEAWDLNSHPSCQKGDKPEWCSSKWCYVDPCECEVDKVGKVGTRAPPEEAPIGGLLASGKPLYMSYATCGYTNSFSLEDLPVPKGLCK